MTPSGYSGNLPTQYAAVDTGPRLTCISIKEPIKTSDNRPKILIVDDDRLNQKLVKALVELEGFYAIVAGSAVEGLSLAETERPDLILMDIQLPDMSGLEATKRIKSSDHLKTTPIVALSAYAMKLSRSSLGDVFWLISDQDL